MQRFFAAQMTGAPGSPASIARQSSVPYSSSTGPNAPAASNLCENCLLRTKSQELDEDGTVITHPYCGIRCYQAANGIFSPASTIPAPAAASTIPAPAAASTGNEAVTLRMERMNALIGRKMSLMMQECWSSDEFHIPKLKAIYRIDLPGQVYRRFDLALQMNNECLVRTSYYGGIAACSIANDTNPTPCTSESCGLCDALRNSFGNLPHGASCSDGDYGPGLYTYSNPALAYHATVPGDDFQPQGSNFALIQCRVVAKADSMPSSSSYAGFIDDSGVVFCAQSTAIIPTHVLIFPSPTTQGKHQPSTDSAIPGLLQSNTTIALKEKKDNCTGQPASTSYESSRGGPLEATKQSPYPLPGHANDDADTDGQLRSSAAPAHKHMKRSNDLEARMDEDDDDFIPLKPDGDLARRMYEEEEEDLDDLPDHPPGYHKPPPRRGPKPLLFYEETEKYYEFSNFAPYVVNFRGKEYPTGEHLFQARKFLDHRPMLAEHIRRGSDGPRFAIDEAGRLTPEIRPDWKEICIEIMEEILELKFTQHNKLRRMLLETGERYLIQNAGKYDDFWGNGADGNGRNELGKALMRLRTTLRERQKEALANAKGKGKLRR